MKLYQFISFKQKWILMKTFVDHQFELMEVYEFQTKANFYEGICWVSVWSYVSLCVSNNSGFLRRHILVLSLKLGKFLYFKPKWILMKAFVESQFEVIKIYDFQTKLNSYQDICWVSVWSYVSLWVSNQSKFWWTHLLSLSLKSDQFMSFKQKRILRKAFVESQFEVM